MNKLWEYFPDPSYYGMWAVRPVGDKDFNSPWLFHFIIERDAAECCKVLSKAYAPEKTEN